MWWWRTLWIWHLKKDPCHQESQSVYYPIVSQLLQSQRRLHNLKTLSFYLGEVHQHPLALPFCGWMSPTHPTGAGRLAHECTPGSPTGFCLLGVPTGDHMALSSDGQSTMWLPVLDHCPDVPDPDVPTAGPPQTPDQPDPFSWIEELRANAMLSPSHKWLHCSYTPRWTLDWVSSHYKVEKNLKWSRI